MGGSSTSLLFVVAALPFCVPSLISGWGIKMKVTNPDIFGDIPCPWPQGWWGQWVYSAANNPAPTCVWGGGGWENHFSWTSEPGSASCLTLGVCYTLLRVRVKIPWLGVLAAASGVTPAVCHLGQSCSSPADCNFLPCYHTILTGLERRGYPYHQSLSGTFLICVGSIHPVTYTRNIAHCKCSRWSQWDYSPWIKESICVFFVQDRLFQVIY